MTISGAVMAAAPFILGARMPMHGAVLLRDTVQIKLVNGLSKGVPMQEAKQSVAKHFSVIMRDPSTGFGAPLSGSTIGGLTVLLKKGGATSYVTIAPVLTAVGGTGLLDLALTGPHLDTLGVAAINIAGPGVLPNDELFIDVVAVDKNDAVRGGMSALPNSAIGTQAGLPTRQNLDDATTAVNAHTDTASSSVTTAVNAHTDTASSSVTTAVNAHTDTATSSATTAVNAHTDTATSNATTTVNVHTDTVASSTISAVNAHTDTAAAGTTTAVNTHTTTALAGLPSPTDILDALLTDHTSIGSVGDAIAIAAGLLQNNFFMDTLTNDSNGQTSARLRLWRDEDGTSGATGGGSGEGEFATFQVITTYSAPGKVATHRVVRVVGA